GSLQEIDHVPFVRPLTRSAQTAFDPADIPDMFDEALTAALRPPTGPTFLDLPLDVVFSEAVESEDSSELPDPASAPAADADDIERVAALLADSDRPVIMAGSDLYWGHGETALRELSEAVGIPVFLNGLARGCLPADHPNFFSRARSAGLKGADLALVIGDAIVIGDGGDFVSFAGRVMDTYEPGCFLDPGPYGCLGAGPGYAIAAKTARPERQVCLLLGDGAFGFSGMEFDTMVRHGLPVVAVVGNNGIWALEKHPMEFLYGYSVAAELRPGTRYDEVVRA